MKATMQLMNGRSFIVDRIFKMDRVGKHTYEFTYWADGPDKNFPIHGKIRVTEVVSISINDTCECHSEIELIEYCSKCGADTANPCGCTDE